MKTFDDTTQMAEFRYDKHGELLSPSGRTTAEMTIADFALMMVTFVFLMLPFMAVVAGHPQWMTPLIVVASVVAVVTFTKRGRRMWLVHRDIRAHGFKGHYEYQQAAAIASGITAPRGRGGWAHTQAPYAVVPATRVR